MDQAARRKRLLATANLKDLTQEQAAELRNIARGGLMKKVPPPAIAEQLIDKGYIEQKLGGLMATDKGKIYDAAY